MVTPVAQHSRLPEPLALHPQPRQRRSRQGIERLPAVSALVALQIVRCAVPDYVLTAAVRATRLHADTTFDDAHRSRLALASSQLCHDLLPLSKRQLPQRFQ
jgi:hypothetical protein